MFCIIFIIAFAQIFSQTKLAQDQEKTQLCNKKQRIENNNFFMRYPKNGFIRLNLGKKWTSQKLNLLPIKWYSFEVGQWSFFNEKIKHFYRFFIYKKYFSFVPVLIHKYHIEVIKENMKTLIRSNFFGSPCIMQFGLFCDPFWTDNIGHPKCSKMFYITKKRKLFFYDFFLKTSHW